MNKIKSIRDVGIKSAELVDKCDANNFPKDYQPLYRVGETIQISHDEGQTRDSITIQETRFNTDQQSYDYLVEVLSTGELIVFNEVKLTEIEM